MQKLQYYNEIFIFLEAHSFIPFMYFSIVVTEHFYFTIISKRKIVVQGKKGTTLRLFEALRTTSFIVDACILFSRFSKSSKVSPDDLLAIIEQLSKSSVIQPENTKSRPNVRFSKDGTVLSKT